MSSHRHLDGTASAQPSGSRSPQSTVTTPVAGTCGKFPPRMSILTEKTSMRMWAMIRLTVCVAVLFVTTQAENPRQKRGLLPYSLDSLKKVLDMMRNDHIEVEVKKPEIGIGQADIKDVPDNFQNLKNQVPQYHSTPSSRRRREEGSQVKMTRVSRADSTLEVFMVEPESGQPRRRSLGGTAAPYNYTICFIFASGYNETNLRILIRRTVRYISDQLCVVFVELNGTANTSDPTWASKNGCPFNSYLLISSGSMCNALLGANSGASVIYPCKDPYIALHEFMHVLGAIHSHQFWGAVSVISLFAQNVAQGMMYAYAPFSDSTGLAMSAYSTLMYSYTSWSAIGEPTFQCMRSDRCIAAYTLSNEFIIFLELNLRYKCTEYACGGAKVNCNQGMYTQYKGKCQCRCPERLDPATNCSTYISGPGLVKTWPTLATVMAGNVDNTCPTGMSATGWMGICGTSLGDDDSPIKLPTDKARITYMPFCTVTSAESTDMYQWPFGGNHCFLKSANQSCGGDDNGILVLSPRSVVFNQYTFQFNNTCPVGINGTVGDISMVGNTTTMNMCCKEEVTYWMVDFPNDKPFRLWTHYYCPKVRGMRDYNYRPSFKVADATANGGPAEANNYIRSYGFYWDVCIYIPPSYGCSLNGSLGIALRNVSYTTPGFPGNRTANKRCFICAQMSEAGFIRVTFQWFDLYSDDDFLISRYDPWLDNSRIDTYNPPKDVISDGPYICLEHWSSWQNVTNVGVSLTMETILAGEVCYNYSTNGADYIGSKNVSEYAEPCLNWKDTLDCYESPYKTVDDVIGYYDGNACRNPYGKHRQPWCFVFKNGTNCIKRYCDVCNLQQPADAIPTSVCIANIASTPNFCTQAIQRFSCALSCNLTKIDPTGCPPNFTPYGSRCRFFTTTTYNWTAAMAMCASYGPNGTLFQIRSSYDSISLRQYRYTRAPDQDVWVNGQLNPANTAWWHTFTNISLMWANWSSAINPYSLSGACAAIYRDTATPSNREGSFWAYSCTDPSLRLTVACQVDRAPACGQPVPPSDGIIVDPPKPSYYEGDRVTVECKFTSNLLNTKYMMCKGGSWTTLNYVCSQCRKSYLVYQTRCTRYINMWYLYPQAEANCNALGPTGTLFRYYDSGDHEYSKFLRNTYGSGSQDMVYVSGKCSAKGKVVFTGTNIIVPFLNMTDSARAACANQSVIYLYRDSSTSAKENSNQCTGLAYNYSSICQMDGYQTPAMDRYPGCQAALGRNPLLCLDRDGTDLCPVSCGIVGNQVTCQTPTSSTYIRTSPTASVGNGEFMTFACVNGTFLTSGDLTRACGLNGTLLGREPVCEMNPNYVDVAMNLLSPRLNTLDTGIAVVLNMSNYRVPMAGKLSVWYCLTESLSSFYLFVVRFNGSSYTIVGSNQVSCYPDRLWGVYVPPDQQISVQPGDMIGMFSTNDYTLQATDCNGYGDNTWNLIGAQGDTFSNINTTAFTAITCSIPCIAYRISSSGSQG